MKRLFSGAVLTMVAASSMLVACSSNTATPSATSGTASTAPTTTTAAPQDKVKLTMGSWRTEDTEAYAKIIAEFKKKNPNIDIEFKPTKNTEYNTALNTALQSGNGPDIIHLRPYAAGAALADAGYLEPLTNVKGMDVFSKDTLLAATGSDGKVYGVPTVFSSTQVFYNKKIFQKYNLQEPKTWDELVKTADTLKKNKVTPFAFGSKEGWILSLTEGTLGPSVYGTDFMKKILSGAANFKSPEYVASIKMMKDLTPYFPDNYVGIGMDDMRNMFVTEQAAMMVMGDWEYAVMKKTNPDLQMDVFPVPPVKADGKQTVTTWVDGSFSVNAKSAHKQEALKFMEFLTSKEFGALAVNELQKPSTIPGVPANDPLVAKIAKNADSISTPYAAVVYFNAGNPTTKATLENSIQGMYLNKLTPEQVTEEVQKSADSWFKPKK
ncbi:extracellular solute-binding protein [Paenibacillus sp. CGMCC 1.16610]|uniref:Extracellular solute-binding protein n=1 Tax=Paenibacillus anseongense TaxID=2682845 RepID=A0ABW9U8P1_9BACL|nr:MULTISPECIES: extracellular solute-binding protein [Paenibacillus]MBA2942577.1 extracellular solute-binding protein [Paenibacillus sp. CGMCC 1.16610]MVQ35391.1 extracellular solute-binding protein [Paenibacillus anseongense]